MASLPDSEESGPAPVLVRFEYANENRQATIGLGGTGVVILTFLLIFFNTRYSAGGVEANLYRATLAVDVVSNFLLAIAGSYYYFLIEVIERKQTTTAPLLERADSFFVGGILLMLAEPALILFTLEIYDIGILAIGLWVISVLVIVRMLRVIRGGTRP